MLRVLPNSGWKSVLVVSAGQSVSTRINQCKDTSTHHTYRWNAYFLKASISASFDSLYSRPVDHRYWRFKPWRRVKHGEGSSEHIDACSTRQRYLSNCLWSNRQCINSTIRTKGVDGVCYERKLSLLLPPKPRPRDALAKGFVDDDVHLFPN